MVLGIGLVQEFSHYYLGSLQSSTDRFNSFIDSVKSEIVNLSRREGDSTGSSQYGDEKKNIEKVNSYLTPNRVK